MLVPVEPGRMVGLGWDLLIHFLFVVVSPHPVHHSGIVNEPFTCVNDMRYAHEGVETP